jgi:hypothetical protein
MNLTTIEEAKAYTILSCIALANTQSWLLPELSCNMAGSIEEFNNHDLMDRAEKEILRELGEKYPEIAKLFEPDQVQAYRDNIKRKFRR